MNSRYKKILAEGEKIDQLMVEVSIQSHQTAPMGVVLDVNATNDPLYGHQEGQFFMAITPEYCYFPLYIFSGEHLLCARLRPGDFAKGENPRFVVTSIISQEKDARTLYEDFYCACRKSSGNADFSSRLSMRLETSPAEGCEEHERHSEIVKYFLVVALPALCT